MSVMHQYGDATGENQPASNPQGSHGSQFEPGEIGRLNHLLDSSIAQLMEAVDFMPANETIRPIETPQATIALNVSDVMDLGTEPIEGIDALIIRGEEGDTVHLANEGSYLWSRAEPAAAPEGYDIYQAIAGNQTGTLEDKPIYVAVQHDLTVVLQAL